MESFHFQKTIAPLNGDHRKKILIIDDEPGILESLEELFNEKFLVLTARDGAEGIELLKSLEADLVILDLLLPEIDGMDILRWIRGLSKTLPVIIITGHSTHERAAGCADSPVQGYLKKPFDSLDLFDRVMGILGEDKEDTSAITADSGSEFPTGLSSIVQESIKFITSHYRQSIRPKDVAARVMISREHLGRKLKEETGYGVGDYINRLRIKKSRQLLLEKRDLKLSEISYEMGFNNDTYFLKTFRRYTGMTPTAFKKSCCPSNEEGGEKAHFEALSRSEPH